MKSSHRVLGAVLLVSGTTIGAGMLALPVVTGQAGFFPSLLIFLAYWAYMTYTAFLFLEVNLSLYQTYGRDMNMISMARHTLGKGGEIASWFVYLFLLYLLTAAYLAGSGQIAAGVFQWMTGILLPNWMGALPLLAIFGFFIYRGTAHVDGINRIFMIGLAVTYGVMTVLIVPHIDAKLLFHMDWKFVFPSLSVVATSFGFHIIIPTLVTYLEKDSRKLKQAILIGSLLPLAVYILWEWMALGVIPIEGPNGIAEGYQEGANGATLIAAVMGHSSLGFFAQSFSFFAIITSFLGVTLSLFDFLADGFKVNKSPKGRALLFAMTFLPPMGFILISPRAFLSALEFAGAFGVVVLLGLMPALMAWSARYRHHLEGPIRIPGGKMALIAVMLFSLGVIAIEILNKV